MYPQAFSLVSQEDQTLTVAVGLEIIGHNGTVDTTITYRPENNGLHSFGTHPSADAAQALLSRITPVTLRRNHHDQTPTTDHQ